MPTPAQREAIRAIGGEVAAIKKSIAAEIAGAAAARASKVTTEDRDDEAAYAGRSDFVWIDDSLPTGASPHGELPWKFAGKPDHPVYSGRLALANKAQGLKQFVFEDAGQKLVVGEGDALFAHVYLDPKQPPREVMLQWHTAGGWSHRAYWGKNAIDWGKDGTPERLAMGGLPATGRWIRLEVPVDRLRLAPGTVIDGWAFTQHGGSLHWDAAGITTRTPQDGQRFDSFAAWLKLQRDAGAAGALPVGLKAAVQLERSKWTGRRPGPCPPISPSTPTPRPRGRSSP